jgi:hypothetical protein
MLWLYMPSFRMEYNNQYVDVALQHMVHMVDVVDADVLLQLLLVRLLVELLLMEDERHDEHCQ